MQNIVLIMMHIFPRWNALHFQYHLCVHAVSSLARLEHLFCTFTMAATAIYLRCARYTQEHTQTLRKKNPTLSVLRPLQDVYVPVCKCECACGDTENETPWVHRGIKWQTSDTHMLSHLTCSRVPAVSGQKRANEKEREAEWHREADKHSLINLYINVCILSAGPQGDHRETIKRGCTATLYN